MAWTDERIDRLRQLWAEGLSASQIATALGEVTRNAVIGKIHRLGLSGRAKASARRPAATSRPRPAARGTAQPMARRALAVGNTVLKAEVLEEPEPAAIIEAEVIPLHGGLTLLELTESHCRWPIGDPNDDTFRFCGRPAPIGVPYCAGHARLARQPARPPRRAAKPDAQDG